MMRLSVLHLSGRIFWCGESRRVLVLCRGLKEHGWPVLLGAPGSSALARRAAGEGIAVDTRFRFDRGFRPASFLTDVRALRRLQRERRFDVIHLHTTTDTWPAAAAFDGSGRPGRPFLVRTRHNSLKSKSDLLHRWLYRRVLDRVILAADGIRPSLSGLYRSGALIEDRVAVIHSSVDVRRFDPARVSGESARREFGLEGRLCIGLIGRISREKGHDLLLRVLPAVFDAAPDAVCLFVGAGDQEARLRREVEQGPLNGRARFAGFRDDIPELVAAMDILVVPSLSLEASPATVKEGMAMGRAVIASDVGGVAEIIRHGTDGWIVPPGDAPALQEALLRLVRDPVLRRELAGRARERIVGHFSDDHLVERTMEFYRRLKGES